MTLYEKYDMVRELYLTDAKVSRKSKNTLDKYRYALMVFGEWLNSPDTEYGKSTASEFPTLAIVAYKQFLHDTGRGNNTIIQYLGVLHCLFKWAIANDLFKAQPVTDATLPEPTEIKHDIPTLEEIQKLLTGETPRRSYVKNRSRNRAIVMVFLLSGVRASELCHLRIYDCNYEPNSLRVSNGKGNKLRFAPYPPIAQEAVGMYLAERQEQSGKPIEQTDYLFVTSEGKPFERQYVSDLVKRYVQRLTGHNGITAHDLRHAAASLWDEGQVPIRTVQKALGHANMQTTERVYVQILNKTKAAQEISAAFSGYHLTFGAKGNARQPSTAEQPREQPRAKLEGLERGLGQALEQKLTVQPSLFDIARSGTTIN